MPKSPSRSEIESALSGHKKQASRKPQSNRSTDLDFGEPPRRQQVLGGNLSGVNTKSKFGLFSRYSELNLANWAAGLIILLILVAFFWPQKKNSVTEVAKQLNKNKVIAVEDQVLEQAVAGNAGFAKDTDKIRAQEYRAQDQIDQNVSALLEQADVHLKARQFTLPRNANAVALYQEVLSLRPNNTNALENLSKIRRHYLFRGVGALDADQPQVANENLRKLALVDRDSSEYQDLASDIKEYKIDSELLSLLQKASEAIAADRLSLPVDRSALTYYQQALELRAGNTAALDGIQSVADAYVDKASSSILNGDLSTAKGYIERVKFMVPEHQSLPLLYAMIKNATVTVPNSTPNSTSGQTPSITQAIETTDLSGLDNNDSPELTISATSTDNTLSTDQTPDSTSTQAIQNLNTTKTPSKQADEQALLDKQYLQQGLIAYSSQEYDTAASLLRPLADKGIARAQMRLAYMHYWGRSFARDRDTANTMVREALPAIRKFANEGRGWAQSDLGSLYEDGLVLPRDYSEAVYWYRTAAEKGFAGAQTQLGSMYSRGRGVSSSRETAIEWFKRAAKQDDAEAKRNLDAMGVTY